ncbi:PPC domain-containing protein, partial [Vibrio parahaemolyticus]|nr:PPC domain-containing protein [Vibrio parahaemolyticus]
LLSGDAYREKLFYVDLPANTVRSNVSIEGAGDADLYMSYNKVAHYSDFEMSQYADGRTEEIQCAPEPAGDVKAGRASSR